MANPARSRHRPLAQPARLGEVPGRSSRRALGRGTGQLHPVHVDEILTFDFADREGFDSHHYCFHVGDAEFDAIFGRIRDAGIKYRSHPRGEDDMQINKRLGGKNLYWEDADGHLWEILTVSYARGDSPALAAGA